MVRLLSPVDAVFMTVEKPTNPIHIGGLHLFRPAAGTSADDLAAQFAVRPAGGLPPSLFTRCAARSWATGWQWSWEQAPQADLAGQVFEHRLPAPGDIRQLFELCSRLHAEVLERNRPLWQAHLISGLADGRFALYFKIHHALGDGMRLQALLRSALSREEDRRGLLPPWVAKRRRRGNTGSAAGADGESDRKPGARSSAEANADSDWLALARSVAAETAGFAGALGRTLLQSGQAEGSPLSFSAPRSILNAPRISGERRFAAQSWPLERIASIRLAAGTSVNDVVLAMCSGALRRYLIELDALPSAPLVAMVPVALGDTGLLGEGSNAVGAVMCGLATDEPDPARRLARIHAGMVAGKAALSNMSSTQVLAMTALAMSPLLVEPILGRVAGSRPPFNVIISNVPGSRVPLYFNGARLDGMYPLSVPVDGQGLNITCTSYVDKLSFGLTGCARTVPRLQRLLGHLDTELSALDAAVRARPRPQAARPRPTST